MTGRFEQTSFVNFQSNDGRPNSARLHASFEFDNSNNSATLTLTFYPGRSCEEQSVVTFPVASNKEAMNEVTAKIREVTSQLFGCKPETVWQTGLSAWDSSSNLL